MTVFTKIAAIALVTLRESVRDKIFYVGLGVGIVVIVIGILGSSLSYQDADRVIFNFGFSSIAIACSTIGIFFGAVVIGREFDHKTMLVILSRPVSRHLFYAGKFIGVALAILMNWLFMLLLYFLVLKVMTDRAISFDLFLGLVMSLFQSILITAIVMTFSTFSSTVLSVLIGVGVLTLGSNVSHIRVLSEQSEDPLISSLMNWASYLVPNLEAFAMKFRLTYGVPIAANLFFNAFVYMVSLLLLLHLVAGYLYKKDR